MDYGIFMKKSFLNQSVGDFSQTFDKADYKDFEHIVSKGSVFGMAKVALKICRKSVKSVFNSVDGIPLRNNGGNNNISSDFTVRKDGYVDREEMYQLIKNSYEGIKGKKISNEEISKMTLRQAIDLVIEYWNNKKQ